MRQAWFIATELGLLYKLSNTLTRVLMHTQCAPMFKIWRNSDVAGITLGPVLAESWSPSTNGKCLLSNIWVAVAGIVEGAAGTWVAFAGTLLGAGSV